MSIKAGVKGFLKKHKKGITLAGSYYLAYTLIQFFGIPTIVAGQQVLKYHYKGNITEQVRTIESLTSRLEDTSSELTNLQEENEGLERVVVEKNEEIDVLRGTVLDYQGQNQSLSYSLESTSNSLEQAGDSLHTCIYELGDTENDLFACNTTLGIIEEYLQDQEKPKQEPVEKPKNDLL